LLYFEIGGTSDITVHEIQHDGSLKELYPPTGGDFGGTAVDTKFTGLLTRIFGADILYKFKQNHMQEYIEMLGDFELKKKLFDGTEKMKMKFPVVLLQFYENEVEMTIEESLQQSDLIDNVEFKLGKVFIEKDMVMELFQEPIDKIIQTTQDLLSKVGNIGQIITVGGFSQSPYLQRMLKVYFRNYIFMPDDPSLAVLKGAVMFGFNPTSIVSRVCRKTYGIARMMKFKPHHPAKKKIVLDGVEYCDDVFCKHIEIGTPVKVGDEESATEHEYYPTVREMKQAVLEVYASNEQSPTFIDDEGCEFVGLIKIDLDTRGDIWSKVLVKMIFGGTELKVKVTDVKNNTVQIASVDFLG